MKRGQPWRQKRWRASLALVVLIGTSTAAAKATETVSPPTRAFSNQDWDLAWQAFTKANDPEDAYALAKSAVQARPMSHLWLKRLAQAAGWTGHPRDSLDALYRLAITLHDPHYLQPALRLAMGLNQNTQAVTLLQSAIGAGKATRTQRQALSGLYLSIGNPSAAIRVLQQEFKRNPKPSLLWKQVAIYRMIGDPGGEMHVLRLYRRRFGPEPRVMMAIATLAYVHGDLDAALQALLAAEPQAHPNQTKYWQTLSGLAWMLGRYRLSSHAAKILIDQGLGDRTLYERVVYVEQANDPKRAFSIAEKGWEQTHDPSLFLTMLDIASSQPSAVPLLQRAFAQIGLGEQTAFRDRAIYWTSLATLQSGEGKIGEALHTYQRALRLIPNDPNLLADYLWFLVDTGNVRLLRADLGRLTHRAQGAPALWAPMAAIYGALDEPQRALPWLQRQWPTHHDDPLWLMDFADMLEQADRLNAAWVLRHRAYGLLSHRALSVGKNQQTRREIIALARLAKALAPGDPTERRMLSLSREKNWPEARLVVLDWALNQHAYSLAAWWTRYAFHRQAPPAWAQLSEALATGDGVTLGRLLRQHRESLPRRDRVDAASTLGWKPLAVSLAWEGLGGEPDDAQLHRQFDRLALEQADDTAVTSKFTDADGLLAQELTSDTRLWLKPADRVGIRLDAAHQKTIDATQLGPPPATSHALIVDWHHLLDRGSLDVIIGTGHNIATWVRYGLAWATRWTRWLDTTGSITIGARPTDTVALSVGALEDRIGMQANLRPTSADSIHVALSAGRFKAQGGGTLGNVQRFSVEMNRQLGLTPLGLAADLSVSGAHFNRASNLPAQLDTLVPATQTPTTSFFVPGSYAQTCAGAHFNMAYRQTYSAYLRPYSAADVCANSVNGFGYELNTGISTPVIGDDNLSMGLDLSNNLGTRNGLSLIVALSYRYYFTPLH